MNNQDLSQPSVLENPESIASNVCTTQMHHCCPVCGQLTISPIPPPQFIGVSTLPESKKPHMCPVCVGQGGKNMDNPTLLDPKKRCHACQGTGIVWG